MLRPSVAAVLVAFAAVPAVARPASDPGAALRGLVPGRPRTCITLGLQSQGSRTFDDHSVVFDGPGRTVFLNRPPDCPYLTSRAALVTRVPNDRVCRGDIFEAVDVPSRFTRGACSYGDFIPYAPPPKP